MNSAFLDEYMVCATDKYSHLTYGKIYRVIIDANPLYLIRIIDQKKAAAWSVAANFIIKDEMISITWQDHNIDFITMTQWRNRKLEQLGIE